MIVVAVTGAIGAGKSTAARILARIAGGEVLDADLMVREVLDRPRIRARLRTEFGPAVAPADRIDRAALASRAFRSPRALARLEAVIHPPVSRLLRAGVRRARRHGSPLLVLDVPLLLERRPSGLRWDCVLHVDATPAARRIRLARRGGRLADWRRRQSHQWSAERKRRAADAVLRNDGSRALLHRRLTRYWRSLRSRPNT